jgi:hypothetical protein
MDLLGGYDSDSGSESVETSEQLHNTKQPPVAIQSILRNNNNNNNNNTKSQTIPQITKEVSKKGKRLLKLSAVLPQEILDRLQRGEGAYESDSDEEIVRQKGAVPPQKAGTKKDRMSTSSISVTGAMDTDIHSLLSDLHSVVPSESKEKEIRKETMGDAFMNVSSTIIRKQKPGQVVNIHEPTTNSTEQMPLKNDTNNKKDIVVEEVHSDSDKEEENDTNIKLQTLFPQAETRLSMKQPLVRRPMDAAPLISTSKGIHSSIKSMPLHSPQEQLPSQGLISKPSEQNEMNLESSSHRSKRSKREIEKALRAGNFENIDSLATQTIDTREYEQPDEHHILATSGLATEGSSSFRTSGLERYVPSEGMSVQGGVVGKMKGKSQIHSLVSSAASYEANQRRMAAMGMGKTKSSRVDAKRKYGW